MPTFAPVNTTALDAANYLLNRVEADGASIDPMQLQKILFYCQCWSLLNGQKLFEDRIEAWKYGPVVRSVWLANSGHDKIIAPDYPREFELSDNQKCLIESVWTTLKGVSGTELSDRTHLPDTAWTRTRDGLPDYAHSSKEISHDEMVREAGAMKLRAEQCLVDHWSEMIEHQS